MSMPPDTVLPDAGEIESMSTWIRRVPLDTLPSPCYVVDMGALRRNLALLDTVQREAGCDILLALKGFALFHVFPLLQETLRGTTASSLDEALLGRECFQGEVHVCAPAYRDRDAADIIRCADHMVFNSIAQFERFGPRAITGGVHCGLRLNPEHSEVETPAYDPCRPCSRLGITAANFPGRLPDGIEGLHFHTLCELGADALERTLAAVEAGFAPHLHAAAWVNFGGGHHITRKGYDLGKLIRLITSFRERYRVQVYLEPGEAIALYAGALVSTVLDVVDNGGRIAVLDTSASAHMPDVLEMPYRPVIAGAGMPGEHAFDIRLTGMTCLAGDEIGIYSFPAPLQPGDRVVFLDMAHYTMVKNTTFNGIRLPSIAVADSGPGTLQVVRDFDYADFRSRLG